MRLLCAVALSASVGLFAACADDKKDPPKDAPPAGTRAEKVAALKTKFNEEFAGLLKKFRDSKDDKERSATRTEARELIVLTAQKAVALAEENPKDEAALAACELALDALGRMRMAGPEYAKAIGLIAEHHLGSPKAKAVLVRVGKGGGDAAQKFLRAAAEKATDPEVKGLALYFLGSALAEQADETADPKKAEALTAEAIGYLEKAVALAPKADVDGEELGRTAGEELTGLKTLGVGKPAPEVEGAKLDGKKVKLSDYKGKVVLLDIWATWCGPCRAMIPHERELVKRMDGKPFELVSVSVDDSKEVLEKFLAKEPMPWTHWWVGKGAAILKTYRVKGFPTLFLIDADGVIRRKWLGAPDADVLDKAVEELVKEAGSKK